MSDADEPVPDDDQDCKDVEEFLREEEELVLEEEEDIEIEDLPIFIEADNGTLLPLVTPESDITKPRNTEDIIDLEEITIIEIPSSQ